MALFSRRYLWQALQRIALFVSEKHINHWTGRLDSIREDYVSAEWEIALVDVFSGLGEVQYEPDPTQPIDIIFKSRDGQPVFAADVATAFDWPLHKQNPVDAFQEQLRRRILKANLNGAYFSWNVGERRPDNFFGRGYKRSLLLPDVNLFPTLIFNNEWVLFLKMLHSSPSDMHKYSVVRQNPPVEVHITYNPRQQGNWGSHGAYTSANLLKDNRLYRSLEKKAGDLKKSRHTCPRGIILCDGGCSVLTDSPNWTTYSVREIVVEFFREHKSIDFVLVLGIKPQILVPGILQTNYEYFPNIFFRAESPQISSLPVLFEAAAGRLPKIQMWPGSVHYNLNFDNPKNDYAPHLSGWNCTQNSITMSALTLLELMAGKLSHQIFLKHHEALPVRLKSFVVMQAFGKILSEVVLTKKPSEDDDLISFWFSDSKKSAHIEESFQISNSQHTYSVLIETLFGLLTGNLGICDFLRVNGSEERNFFAERLGRGEMITGTSLHVFRARANWLITFSFGSPDAAITPFRVLQYSPTSNDPQPYC